MKLKKLLVLFENDENIEISYNNFIIYSGRNDGRFKIHNYDEIKEKEITNIFCIGYQILILIE